MLSKCRSLIIPCMQNLKRHDTDELTKQKDSQTSRAGGNAEGKE